MKIPYDGKLAIFTSFYSHLAYAPYISCLATTLGLLHEVGIKHLYLMRPSDFHADRAINNTLTELMERDDITDVLLIDSDESWNAEDVVRLLLHPEEIVAAVYPMKNAWDKYTGTVIYEGGFPQGKMLKDGTPLLKASRVPAGFLRLKISALRKWAAAYPDLISEEPDGKKIQFFQRALIDGEMGCQDMVFSKRCIDAGIDLWIDPNINIQHWGFEAHTGDFNAHLKAIHSPPPDPFKVVADMAAAIEARKAA